MRPRAAILALVLAASAAAQANRVWIDVPFVRQVENGCGAAAVSMVMQYWQRHGAGVDPKAADMARIDNQLYVPELHGILASGLSKYLEDHGFQVVTFRGRREDLSDQLAKGRPLIVALRSGRESHYVVVAGIGPDTVEMNDPADRKLRQMGRAEFEKKWGAVENWTLLAVPRLGS